MQKLIPGLVKPGYSEDSSSNTGGTAPQPSSGPNHPRPGVPYPDPDPEGEGRIGAPPRLPSAGQGQNPLEIGRSDLDPLGGQVGRLPGVGGDGMMVGPGHPLFNRERQGNDPLRMPGQTGPWGGDGFLPPLGAPPGARFDPVGPFGGPGQPGFPGNARRNWGDEFPPPVRA